MRVVGSLFLLGAGAVVGSYLYGGPSDEATEQLANIAAIVSTAPNAAVVLPRASTDAKSATTGSRVFSSQSPLLAPPAETVVPHATRTAAAAGGSSQVRGPIRDVIAGAPASPVGQFSQPSPDAVVTTVNPVPVGEAKTVDAVQRRMHAATPATAVPERRNGGNRVASEEARAALVRDLQRELKRVGCYDGDVDGVWGGVSKRAMTSFTERVNASLPVEEPDFILLTLVQGHQVRACGKDCPAGQAFNDDNKCVPKAIMAQAPRKSPAASRRSGDEPAADPAPRLIAEPRPVGPAERRTAELPVPRPMPLASAPPMPASARPAPATTGSIAPTFPVRPPQATGGTVASLNTPIPSPPLPSRLGGDPIVAATTPEQPVSGKGFDAVNEGWTRTETSPRGAISPAQAAAAAAIAAGVGSAVIVEKPKTKPKATAETGSGRSTQQRAARFVPTYSLGVPPSPVPQQRYSSGGSGSGRSSSLKTSEGVRSFFFGPGRSSF